MATIETTHELTSDPAREVLNQPPPLEPINLYRG